MGWFDEQIRQRKQNDDDVFADSFVNMAAAVLGSKVTGSLSDGSAAAKSAIDEILKYYHVKSREVPDNIKDTNEQLEYLMRPYGIMRRTVRLEKGWYRDAVGAMLGVMKESGRVVALIPTGFSGYCYIDPDSGKKIKINRRNQRLFDSEAIAFYKPFPLKKIGLGSVAKYIAETLSAADFALIALATLALSLIGMLSPKLNNILFAAVLPSGSVRLLLSIAVFTVSVSVSSLLISATKEMITARINTKMSVSVQAAAMMRIMSLPRGAYIITLQYAGFRRAYNGAYLGVFAHLHFADIYIRSCACSACNSGYFGNGCFLAYFLVCANAYFKKANGAFGKGKRHELRAHKRHTEN